jgi:hypothetical protein
MIAPSLPRFINFLVLLLAVVLPIQRHFSLTKSHSHFPLTNQKNMMSGAPPPIFILDFDGTITTKDTISTLAQCAVSFQQSRAKDMQKDWDYVVAAYSEDCSKHVESYKPSKGDRTTLKEELDWLRGLKAVEERSFSRVSNSGIFAGISQDDWWHLGRDAVERGDVGIRRGFKEFVESVTKKGGQWGVVSVNFSTEWIKGVLSAVIGAQAENVRVLANSPDERGILRGPEGEGGGEGEVMATSNAKLEAVMRLLREWDTRYRISCEEINAVYYIGDSGTDLECLIEDETIGVAMAEKGKSSLMDMLQRIGVKTTRIEQYQEDSEVVHWAEDFEQIARSPLCR